MPTNRRQLNRQQHTRYIKQLSTQLGFNYCGIARAERLSDDAKRLEQWLAKGFHGSMQYMERHFDLRTDPRLLVPGARSVITLLMNYFPAQEQAAQAPKISKYAWGKDYHEVIRKKLNELLSCIQTDIGAVNGRGFVDSAPVLERSWAKRSGLGWIGKNGNLITKKNGSFFFIATIVCDLDLEPDPPLVTDHCGSCTRCVDACPTEAILPNREIDGSKCISYYTIELKDAFIPAAAQEKFEGWMFGCDVCQDVCPWNRFSKPTTEPGFEPLHEILQFSLSDWQALTEENFRKIFKDSPLKRAGFKGILRNLNAVVSR